MAFAPSMVYSIVPFRQYEALLGVAERGIMERTALYELAAEAATKSYSPYSRFRVGAALLCADGSVVCAANVENRSYGLAICAERSAFVSAIAQGKTEFAELVIATPDSDYPVSPCGACRQFISEFVGADFPIRFGCSRDSYVDSSYNFV